MRILKIWFLVITLATLSGIAPFPLHAQDATAANTAATPDAIPEIASGTVNEIGVDYTLWNRTAQRAEDAVEAGRASDIALENLRGQVASWRESFLSSQNINSARIQTLNAQLAVLGPVPETGGEAEEIAVRRAELTAALARARLPGLTAEEAYSQADGLIRQIDAIIRDRQTDALIKREASPLNPASWGPAVNELIGSGNAIWLEIKTAWDNPIQKAATFKKLPVILALLALAAVLLLRGRRWTEFLTHRLMAKDDRAWRWLLGFVVSLGQVVLPLLGVICLTEAIYATELVGLRGDILLSTVPVAGFAFLLACWLGVRIYPKSTSEIPYLNLSDEQRREGRFFSGSIGLLIGVNFVILRQAQFENFTTDSTIALVFVILTLVALMVFRIGQLLIKHYQNELAESEEPSYRNRMLRLLGRVAMGAVVIGVLLGAIGYFNAAVKIVFPSAMTLALLAILLILQRLVAEVYVLVTRRDGSARDSLVPVLIGFVLAIAAAPVLALIWGARLATLMELWTKFVSGVSVGDTKISPTVFLTLAVIFVIGYMITRLFQGALRTTILPKTRLDAGGQNAIVSGTGYIGIFFAALIAITGAGIDLSALGYVAGALSVGIGFGLQNVVSNFVSGIILLIERPISEGDWIEVSGKSGYVRDISVRSTRIETFDRADVIVPNADLISGVVMNMTKGSLTGRIIVPVGVAYGNDTRKVAEILQEVAEAHPMVVLNPPPGVVFQGFGADSLDFEIRAILRDVNWSLSVKSDMNHEISRRFAEEDIEIPFTQRDIWIRNPEALVPPAKSASAAAKPLASKPGDATEDVDLGAPASDSATPEDDSA